MTKELETVILETPNLVFTKKDLGIKQIRNNIIAMTVLFTTGLQVLATITPLMKKKIPQETNWLVTLLNSNGGVAVITKNGEDPDEVALALGDRYKAPIITNDKFKQKKYKKYKSRSRVIRFKIRENKLLIRNKWWREHCLGGKKYE